MKRGQLLCIVFIWAVVSIASFSGWCVAEASDKKITIDFSCTMAPESVLDKASVHFKDLIEKRSNGKIAIKLYRHGSLFDPKGEIEAIAHGGLHMAILTNLGEDLRPSSSSADSASPVAARMSSTIGDSWIWKKPIKSLKRSSKPR